MHRIVHRPQARLLLLALAATLLLAACGGGGDAVIASFERDWGDGRVETMEVYADGRVLMDHMGTIDRATLTEAELARLTDSMARIVPAGDPGAFPKLTLTPAGEAPTVVAADAGTAGASFLSLLQTHKVP